MTQAEAAQVIGVSAVTVKRWLSRGLRLVTEKLADFRPGEEPPDAIQVHTGREGVHRTHEAQDERGRASVGPPLGRPKNLLAADRPQCGCEEWEVESP